MSARTEVITEAPSLAYGRLVLQAGSYWLSFADPVRIISTHEPEEIEACLREIDDAVSNSGLYAAGFMTYEAGAAYDLAVHLPEARELPLLWFGLYDCPRKSSSIPARSGTYRLDCWHAGIDKEAYFEAIEQIKQHIALADTYQVNFTMRLRARFSGDPWTFYCDLNQAQQASHTAYLDLGRYVICSASPELFFRLEGDLLTARPMKGTAVRGRTLAEDRAQMGMLRTSVKDRAENVMIVDMIRNDFGRVAEIGSVDVPSLFTVERYPTLLQMTSTVTARSMASLPQIMEAMFPCASITGAPKVRTMEIINELEPEPRGIYTGTIGYLGPDRQASFNVAIRTVVIDRDAGQATYGVGSGIVWDSKAADEYAECHLKSQVLVERRPSFELLESLLWTPDEGFFLFDLHMERLADSAQYFSYPFDEQAIRLHLAELAQVLTEPQKIRFLLARDGRMTSQASSLGYGSIVKPVRVCLAEIAVDSHDFWLYHKTSRRKMYEEALTMCPDGYDVILWNEHGEITEASSSNVIVELDGQLITPPVSAGLLAGTYRRYLLEQGCIQERTVTIADLKRSSQIFLINSVRKLREAVFINKNSLSQGDEI
jgi:para-aminobenzoate synthetase/4-amino-4-deoxychorismate lyase